MELGAGLLHLEGPARHAGGMLGCSPAGNVVWGTSVFVDGAYRLRLHLTDVSLPVGTRLWVWGLGEEPRAFGAELATPGGSVWTPSVGGEWLFFEVEVPRAALAAGAAARLLPLEVVQSFRLDSEGRPVPGFAAVPLGECLVDATCIGSAILGTIADYRKAVAHLQFVDGGSEFICTGALLNDTDATSTAPYLLTANHCFATQAVAATLEAFFDYRTTSCNGAAPNLSGLPRVNGATLLATGEETDFTFLLLASLPAGRALLGWDANPAAAANNAPLHRVSHPFGDPQSYSASTMRTAGVPVCAGAPRPDFLYAAMTQGATFGGSSGGPVVNGGGVVVGQLTGGCPAPGHDGNDGCDYANSELDGAFSATFPSIQAFLSPVASVCTPGPNTLCLNGGRFEVEVAWRTGAGASGLGGAVSLTGDTGYFWFFDPSNVEMVIKVLNACTFNNRFWVFAAGLTDVQVVTTVTDTANGSVRIYTNPLGTRFAPVQDTSAFATCP